MKQQVVQGNWTFGIYDSDDGHKGLFLAEAGDDGSASLKIGEGEFLSLSPEVAYSLAVFLAAKCIAKKKTLPQIDELPPINIIWEDE